MQGHKGPAWQRDAEMAAARRTDARSRPLLPTLPRAPSHLKRELSGLLVEVATGFVPGWQEAMPGIWRGCGGGESKSATPPSPPATMSSTSGVAVTLLFPRVRIYCQNAIGACVPAGNVRGLLGTGGLPPPPTLAAQQATCSAVLLARKGRASAGSFSNQALHVRIVSPTCIRAPGAPSSTPFARHVSRHQMASPTCPQHASPGPSKEWVWCSNEVAPGTAKDGYCVKKCI